LIPFGIIAVKGVGSSSWGVNAFDALNFSESIGQFSPLIARKNLGRRKV